MIDKRNILVLGSGAREHAIAQKLIESAYINKLFLADSNDGFSHLGKVIKYEDFEDLAKKALENKVDILVVGPENPLCDGIADIFKRHGISVIGVDKTFSRLESSKYFAKKFMEKYEIKTAKYKYIQSLKDFDPDDFKPPYVIKAEGLCKGKGVKITTDKESALETVREYLSGRFGEASQTLLAEEFLGGEEFSLMSLFDGETLISFLPARDYKKFSSDPNSPNTGGMGAFCPVRLTNEQAEKLKAYERKLENALKSEKADFSGFIYSGLIWHNNDFYVLEYNVRLGDPETQALLTQLKSDLGEIFISAVNKNLKNIGLKWYEGQSACIVLSADTYPEKSSHGKKISGLPLAQEEVSIYFAGVKKIGEDFYTDGGRIISICANGEKPFIKAFEAAQSTDFEGKYFRADLMQLD